MRKSAGRLSMLLLLLACVAVTCSESRAGDTPSPAQEVNPNHLPELPVSLLSFIRPIISDVKLQECWRSLLATESCVTSVFQSILGGRLGLGPECCKAIEGLGDNCVPKMFILPLPLGNFIPGLIKGVCGAAAPAPPKA